MHPGSLDIVMTAIVFPQNQKQKPAEVINRNIGACPDPIDGRAGPVVVRKRSFLRLFMG
jgi:hypothetical protein